jgi:hypothetical protein
MRTHSYEGQRFVQELPPEALTPNPPDMVVALVNATDVRMQRTPWRLAKFHPVFTIFGRFRCGVHL